MCVLNMFVLKRTQFNVIILASEVTTILRARIRSYREIREGLITLGGGALPVKDSPLPPQ